MVGDTGKYISQPGLRINAVELGCLDQRVGNGSRSAAAVRAHKKVILPPESYASHAAHCGVVVDTQTAIVEIRVQPLEASQAITNGTGQSRLARDLRELGLQPRLSTPEQS
jgi:hypothetical protein